MKTPLHYQMTEYDCGPITVMNAIIYLFEREQIPPDLIRNIMLYCLDGYGAEGAPGKSGTTRAAMMFLSNFLCSFGCTGQLEISSRYLSGSCVRVSQNSSVTDCLRRGGTAGCTMNGANEVAVAAFLAKRCGYLDIVRTIEHALEEATFVARPTLDDYAASDAEARRIAREFLKI